MPEPSEELDYRTGYESNQYVISEIAYEESLFFTFSFDTFFDQY